ncbi:MAG: methionyl-tRNA formyltransferase [Lachnospiraceae bacterium]|nr:methionyl-tRNA formyltransferase [Lachnospiraceae bacterium]
MGDRKIKVGFMGTPDFACPTLEKLYNDKDIELCFVVTKEDKPAGRGKEIKESDVKQCIKKLCESKNTCFAIQDKYTPHIFTPHKIKEDREVIDAMKKCDVDFIVVVAYGQILSKEILDIPKYACINGHASILPKYRGSSPTQGSILAGDKETGTTAMLMSEGLDEGDILNIKKIDIKDDDTGESLFEKLSYLTADVVVETIKNYKDMTPIKQDNEKATYVKMIKKEDGLIDPKNETFSEIDRKVRAYYPWPGAYIIEKGKRIKIFKIKYAKNLENMQKNLIYQVKDGYMEVLELQQEGKKRMSARDYLNGVKA